MKVAEAYEAANYDGSSAARFQLRHDPKISARIDWMLKSRVDALTTHGLKAEKKLDDVRLRVIQELERVAFSDIRELVAWDKRPVMNADGDVIGFEDQISAVPSNLLSRDAGARIKSVTTKSGALKVEVHDKLSALEKLMKVLGMGQEHSPPPGPTIGTINIAGDSALEAIRRVAFLFAAAEAQAPRPGVLIEGTTSGAIE